VLLEAMASGMPVITAETCGMPDVVTNDFNGLLVTPADAVGLEKAIARLAESEELRARLGRAAQESMKRYEWASAAVELEALFLRVVRTETSG
jgi:glycosyltransferase involved in cell wall biosynthesis